MLLHDRCCTLEKLCDILMTQSSLVEDKIYYLQLAMRIMIMNKVNKSIKSGGKHWIHRDSVKSTMILNMLNNV